MIIIKDKDKIAAAYIRVSTDDQLELSPDSQREKILEYAASNGMCVPEKYIFIEGEKKKGLSGRSAANRPKFQEMIALAKEKPKPFECILLWKFSRFARNIDEATYYKSVLRNKCGIDVISVSEPISDGMYGRLVEMIIEWSDEFYSHNLAGEVKRGMCAKAKAGEFSSYAPFGYSLKDKKLLPDTEKAKIVKEIYTEYSSGRSPADIAATLRAKGVKTRYGNQISHRFITYIITNPIYKGYIAFCTNGKRKKGELSDEKIIYNKGIHEPIIEESLWQKCFERYQLSKMRHRRGRCKNENPLRSLLFCSDCGAPITSSGKGYLQCSKYSRGECKISHSINAELAEEIIFDRLKSDIENFAELNDLSRLAQNNILLDIIEKIEVHKNEEAYAFEIFYR